MITVALNSAPETSPVLCWSLVLACARFPGVMEDADIVRRGFLQEVARERG